MSRNIAAHILSRPDRLRVRFFHSAFRWLLGAVCIFITFVTFSQADHASVAVSAVEAIHDKDVNWLLAFVAVIANTGIIVIAKAYQQTTREAQITAVETARAVQRMADSTEGLAESIKLHDERVIKFIDTHDDRIAKHCKNHAE